MQINPLRKSIWESCALALAVALIAFFSTAPVHPLIVRVFKVSSSPELLEVSFVPEARVPRTGSRGDGDYDRWRKTSSDRR